MEAAIKEPKHRKLGEWYATALCGNDITSSCLYVSALSLLWAGALGPVVLIVVAAVLFLFRKIYSEVVSALPLNGGAYNALLNTTSKFRASLAACLTILSYFATAVISASEAVHYAASVVRPFMEHAPSHQLLYWLTVGLLGLFALLTIRGIGESAQVALCIFIFHMVTLSVLVVASIVWLCMNGLDTLYANFTTPPPYHSNSPIFFGFAVAMLGISGFESSANFVEEQQDGVFSKTLRNMWIAVSFFNPLICFLALAIVPLGIVSEHREALLAHLGNVSGGSWLGIVISVDAAIVLSGAVLTSYVGTTGLVHRMTLDRCLPQFLLKASRFGTFHRIIVAFFVLCGLLLALAKDLDKLAGVYTISFLAVMALFALGNMLLKVKRNRLPRETRASWVTVFLALGAVLAGLIGNILLNTENVKIFLIYFIPTMLGVCGMLWRTQILSGAIYLLTAINESFGRLNQRLTRRLESVIDRINAQQVVFFTRGDNVSNLNLAILYVKQNELTSRIRIVTVVEKAEDAPEPLKRDIKFLDRVYPEIRISLDVIEGQFTPELLEELSTRWRIPLNYMFIGSPGDHFPHRLSDLGGVRLII